VGYVFIALRRLRKPCRGCLGPIEKDEKCVAICRSHGRKTFHIEHYVDSYGKPMVDLNTKPGEFV
jgi:hypothetical protein